MLNIHAICSIAHHNLTLTQRAKGRKGMSDDVDEFGADVDSEDETWGDIMEEMSQPPPKEKLSKHKSDKSKSTKKEAKPAKANAVPSVKEFKKKHAKSSK